MRLGLAARDDATTGSSPAPGRCVRRTRYPTCSRPAASRDGCAAAGSTGISTVPAVRAALRWAVGSIAMTLRGVTRFCQASVSRPCGALHANPCKRLHHVERQRAVPWKPGGGGIVSRSSGWSAGVARPNTSRWARVRPRVRAERASGSSVRRAGTRHTHAAAPTVAITMLSPSGLNSAC